MSAQFNLNPWSPMSATRAATCKPAATTTTPRVRGGRSALPAPATGGSRLGQKGSRHAKDLAGPTACRPDRLIARGAASGRRSTP